MIHHADCHEVLPTLPANSLQLVLEDMPYFKTNLDFDCTLSVGKNGKGKPIVPENSLVVAGLAVATGDVSDKP